MPPRAMSQERGYGRPGRGELGRCIGGSVWLRAGSMVANASFQPSHRAGPVPHLGIAGRHHDHHLGRRRYTGERRCLTVGLPLATALSLGLPLFATATKASAAPKPTAAASRLGSRRYSCLLHHDACSWRHQGLHTRLKPGRRPHLLRRRSLGSARKEYERHESCALEHVDEEPRKLAIAANHVVRAQDACAPLSLRLLTLQAEFKAQRHLDRQSALPTRQRCLHRVLELCHHLLQVARQLHADCGGGVAGCGDLPLSQAGGMRRHLEAKCAGEQQGKRTRAHMLCAQLLCHDRHLTV